MSKLEDLSKDLDDEMHRSEARSGDGERLLPDRSASHDRLHRLIHELAMHRIELEMQQEELLQSRDELEQLLERYIELYDFAPLGYFTVARDSTIIQVNLTGSKLLGLERSKLMGDHFSRFIVFEDQAAFNTMMADVFAEKSTASCEVRLESRIGNPAFSGADITISALTGEQVVVRIDSVVSQDSQECRMTLSDISERKKVEIENTALQASVAQLRKMDSIGRLAGGLAHDFNNMLQIMLGNIDLMVADGAIGYFDPQKLSDMRQSVLKTATLTRHLLVFARNQPYSPKVLDFSETVGDMLRLFKELMGEHISLLYHPSTDRLLVKMDPSQIDQILTNLVVNARDAINDAQGTIDIQVSGVTIDQTSCKADPESLYGRYVKLSVSDDGCGMNDKTLECAFDPFFTTKPSIESIGFGLTIVYGIVKQNCGFVRVRSEVGKGTTFEVFLPLYIEAKE